MALEAFILGLSAGTSCIVTCAPVAVPVFLSRERKFGQNARHVGLFLGGRLIGYLIVGLLLGGIGAFVLGYVPPEFESRLLGYSNIAIGVVLTSEAILLNFPKAGICRILNRLPHAVPVLVLGLLTGLSVCPPFIAAGMRVLGNSAGIAIQTRGPAGVVEASVAAGMTAAGPGSATAAGSSAALGALSGALYFLFFFLGTTVYFLPLLFIPLRGGKMPALTLVARMSLFLIGIYFFLFIGLFSL